MPRPTLTPRQRELFDYLRREIAQNGNTTSLRQTAAALGISHTAVARLLRALEEKGYLRRTGRYSREVEIVSEEDPLADSGRSREVPVIGQIAAGMPLYAQQEWDGSVMVDRDIYGNKTLFALRVRGDSMKNAGILDGDVAICEPRQFAENGEIVVALLYEEEATVKRFFFKGDHIVLQPENEEYQPMRYGPGEILIQGKVVGIQRGPEQMARL